MCKEPTINYTTVKDDMFSKYPLNYRTLLKTLKINTDIMNKKITGLWSSKGFNTLLTMVSY